MSYPFPYKIIGYANDIAIVCWHKVIDIAISNLQLIANDTVAKCDRYLLDIKALKTIFMIFSNKGTIEPRNFKIKENIISPSATSKFVGFELDTKLSWKSHIEEKCRAIQRQIHLLPIELKILEFYVNYYLFHKNVEFSPSSAATIGAVLHKPKLD
jgi:hypothetical protein